MHPTIPSRPLRGVVIHRFAEAVRALGHDVRLYELGDGEGIGRYLRARPRIRDVVRTWRPELVHVHFGFSGVAIPRLPVPLVTSFLGDDLNGSRLAGGGMTLKSRVGIAVSHVTAARSRRCIAVSASLRDRLRWRRLRDRTVVIRDAVDASLFRPLPQGEARARLGLDPGARLVLFPHDAGQANKRVWLAEAAVRVAAARVPAVRLLVVNDAAPDAMPWYYAAADALIVTSMREGGPSSVKEALACGLPVVSVPVGDVELFSEVPDLMFRALPDPEDLAAALGRAFAVAAGPRRSRLPAELTLDAAARRTVRLYQEVLGERGGS